MEFFISAGVLYFNEMAPRPHNSGHYPLIACDTSSTSSRYAPSAACRSAVLTGGRRV